MTPETKLAELLAAHRPYGLDCKCGEPINSDGWWAAHVAEVISKTPGIAVVELPGAADDWHIQDVGTVGVYRGETGVAQTGVFIKDVGFDLVVTTHEARELAAALLAAVVVGQPTEQPEQK